MALAALIIAHASAAGSEGGLRATLPLAGRTVVEHQARQAARAGASPIILLVERLPAALTQAIDRLRGDGLVVEVARTVPDAADRIHPDERLLLITDGCVASPDSIDRLAQLPAPALLTVDAGRGEPFELIDSSARWGGVALLDGALLRDTAAMLGEWDLASTLLRRIVQVHARRLAPGVDASALPGGGLPLVAESAERIGSIEQALLAGPVAEAGGDWSQRLIAAPVARLATPLLLSRVPEPAWIAMGAAMLAILAVPPAALGLWALAFLLLLLSGPVIATARRLAAVRLGRLRNGRLIERVRIAGIAAAALGLSGSLAAAGGWGWWLVGGLAVGASAALGIERRIADRLAIGPMPRWLAGADALIWTALLPSLAGRPGLGLAAAAAHAIASFVFVQRSILVSRAAAPGDAV